MPVLRSVAMICPVDRDRNRRRSRRYSCPRSRASMTSGLGPFALSYSSSPSSTQIVVWNADRKHPSVDTGLDLAVEERRVAELLAPGAAVAHLVDGPSHPIARRVHAEISQQLERVHGRDPGVRY